MTAQVQEDLILNGKKTSMTFCPPLPENDPRIVEIPLEKIKGDGIILSTACWRQYIGTWEIKDGRFYLVGIKGKFKLAEDKALFADWFSGTLIVPEGKILEYVHMGFDSVFERETHIKIENGVVVDTVVIDNKEKSSS